MHLKYLIVLMGSGAGQTVILLEETCRQSLRQAELSGTGQEQRSKSTPSPTENTNHPDYKTWERERNGRKGQQRDIVEIR